MQKSDSCRVTSQNRKGGRRYWKNANFSGVHCRMGFPPGMQWRLALKMGIKTISFPSIITGAYGYPVEKAGRAELQHVVDFLKINSGLEEVRFVLQSDHVR